MGIEDLTVDDVLESLREYLDTSPPELAFNIKDMMRYYDLTEDMARKRIEEMLADGAIVEWPHLWRHFKWYIKVEK